MATLFLSAKLFPHCVRESYKVGESFAQVALVEINLPKISISSIRLRCGTYIDEDKTLEVLGWVRNELLAVWAENPGVTVVFVWALAFRSRWSVKLDALSGDGLEGSKGESSGLNGVSWSNDLR